MTEPAREAHGPQPAERAGSLLGRARQALNQAPLLAPVTAIFATIALIIAGGLPVWGTRLIAPQYPNGLELWFYGGRVEGPVREINALNHYIGMRPIDLNVVPEMALWPLAVVSGAVFVALASLWRGWLSRLALLGLWLIPLTVLGDIQRWLIIFGSQLDQSSALRLKPFVPLVLGPSRVWNFTVWGYPGAALVGFALVALVVLLVRRAPPPDARLRLPVALSVVVLSIIGAFAYVMPASQGSQPPAAGDVAPGVAAQQTPGVSIQALIGRAAPGSTVHVPAGTYHERIDVDRPLTLVADGEVLIHGGGRGTVVTVSSHNVTLRGFRISGSGGQGEDAAGVKVLAVEGVSLEDLVVEDSFTGIAAFGATDLTLTGNEIAGSGRTAAGADHATSAGAPVNPGPTPNPQASPAPSDSHSGHVAGAGPQGQGDGISLWAARAVLLRDNFIHDVRDGIYLNYTDDVLLDTNDVSRSRYAVHVMFGNGVTVFGNGLSDNLSGLVFMYTANVLVGRNTIVDHRSPGTGFGVVTKDVVGLRIAENVIARNRVGFRAEATAHQPGAPAEVLRNRFSGNDAAVSLMASADIGFGANVFEGNLIQVLAPDRGIERRNQWTYQGTGNKWSDYRGYDLAQDGTGDVAYVAYGTAEQLVAADPALQAFVTAPAYEIYARAQQMWAAGRDPMIIDHAPLTRDTAPPLSAGRQSGGPLGWWLAGAVLLLAGVFGRFGSAGVPRFVRDRLVGGLSRV